MEIMEETTWKESRYSKWLRILAGVYFLLFALFGFLRYQGFGYSLVDHGSYVQLFWNVLQGNGAVLSTVYPFNPDTKWFGFHFTPLLFSALPLYWLFPYAEIFSLIQVACVVIAVFPLVAALRALGATHRQAFFWGAIYLLNPLTVFLALFSFQNLTFSLPLMALGLYGLAAKRYGIVWLSAFLLILSMEHHGATVFMFGLVWAWMHREVKKGLWLSGTGIAALVMIFFVLMPMFSGGQGHAYFSSTMEELSPEVQKRLTYNRYVWMKGEPHEVIARFSDLLFGVQGQVYYSWLFIPLLGLPLFGLIFLFPALPDIMATVLSDRSITRLPHLHYNSAIIPCLIIAAYCGASLLARVWKKKDRILTKITGALYLFQIVLFFFALKPTLSSAVLLLNPDMAWAWDHNFKALKARIPQEAKVLTQSDVGAHFSARHELYQTYAGLDKGDTLIYNLSPFAFRIWGPPLVKPLLGEVQAALNLSGWGVTYWDYPWIMLERGKADVADRDEVMKALFLLDEKMAHYRKIYKQQ